MKFFTEVPIYPQSENQIAYDSRIVGLGSCFVENIGEKLEYYKFRTLLNPFGILFNPISIETFITRSIKNEVYTEYEIFEFNSQFHCYDAHSDLNAPSAKDILFNLNSGLSTASAALKQSTHIIITLGTAWVYENNANNKIVANCHKMPQSDFTKKLLSIDSIVGSIENLQASLKKINPWVTLIFTVSPIRHIKDGMVENGLSKSHLISAVHEFVSYKENSFYFPAYEIMIDELRDYRFYKRDLIHPNEIAIDIIWARFKESWISKTAFRIMDKIGIIQSGIDHKPFNPSSVSHQQFLQNLENQKRQILEEFPHIKF